MADNKALKRPGFARVDTDTTSDINLSNLNKAGQSSKSPLGQTSGLEFTDPDFKSGVIVQSTTPGDLTPPYDGAKRPSYSGESYNGNEHKVAETAQDLVTRVIEVEDDTSLNPWTFRMVFLGVGLSIFASVLQEIFYFKPQTIYVSQVFLTVLAYILGEAMAFVIPRKGFLKYLNPHPFHLKEHAAITLMASAAGQSALATEALAAQELFYGGYPNKAAGIFITLASQLIGYAIAGMLRQVLVWPTKMLWPMNLPITSLLEALHKDKVQAKRRLKVFYIGFLVLFVWELFPEYVFPLLEGVSIFCLARQDNLVFTNLFGGASGNEGLGFLSFCFDWQYIAGLGSPMWFPLYTLTNNFIGYIGCIILFMGVYYGNIWRAKDFPFLSQLLYTGESNGTYYAQYNQTLILNAQSEIDFTKVPGDQGYPFLTATYVAYLITSNMGLTATFTHMLLWNFDDIKAGWAWASPSNLRKFLSPETWKFWKNQETPEERLARTEADPLLDPHYKLMLRNLYPESPMWWWGACFVISWAVGLGCLYAMGSTLPWWGYVVATLLTTLCMLFFGAQYGITGFQFNIQPICQMLGGYMFEGRPLANMYFTCFTYNALQMGQVLAKDLKLGQYVHLAPRVTFFVQVAGCIIGALFNYIMMITIVQNQAPLLKSIEGSNIWSGQNIQQFNTLAIAWSMPKELFSVGGRYEWVTISYLIGFAVPLPFWLAHRKWPHITFFSYINLSIILWYMGWLFVGINASITMYFIIGFAAQWWVRKRYPEAFVKYNYILSAALDGGTQVLVFILTFAVFGGSGKARPFPIWAGNPDPDVHNLDYCMVSPSSQTAASTPRNLTLTFTYRLIQVLLVLEIIETHWKICMLIMRYMPILVSVTLSC
ncbi:OPT-domain-containing protein [Polychaeton citri CBS 116435]|uniref:OPT-domain-containing protein n=1 Tax=Polychaeton citri CBS 116435 TaxID=1314669 RepID=A0A9P4Q7W5_9PEZI|nr:OPT-domain-containing protein [Polychaeton citri CBS 116435]